MRIRGFAARSPKSAPIFEEECIEAISLQRVGRCIDRGVETESVRRGGGADECRLVFPKPFQHLTFRLGSRFHQVVILLGPSLP